MVDPGFSGNLNQESNLGGAAQDNDSHLVFVAIEPVSPAPSRARSRSRNVTGNGLLGGLLADCIQIGEYWGWNLKPGGRKILAKVQGRRRARNQ